MQHKYKLAIIGGGPAGLTAALEASRFSKDVVQISQEKPGGRALWHSLTPSKVWLHAATVNDNTPAKILARLEEVKNWQDELYARQLQTAGIELLYGAASFADANTINVNSDAGNVQSISAEKIIVAAGSVPIFTEALKPDGKRIIAPRLLGKLDNIPKSIIIVGGGVTGSEMAYLFLKLGAKVTVVTDMPSLLPRADREVSDTLEEWFKSQGVEFYKSTRAESAVNQGQSVRVVLEDGAELSADYAFLAIGRKADLSSLQLDHANVEQHNGIRVDEFCRTNIASIYAAGDVTGAPMTANRAMAMGRLAAKNALSGNEEAINEKWIIEAVYTEPEVAQVGDVSGAHAKIYKADFKSNQKAHIANTDIGFMKVFVDEQDRLVGASGIGYHIADLMFSVAVAIRAGMSMAEFKQVVPANPTLSEIFTELQ